MDRWKSLDRDLGRIGTLEMAGQHVARSLVAPGLGLVFMALVGLAAALSIGSDPGQVAITVTAVIAAYMAMNIGANDVANSMGPAVGAKALTLGGALALAAVCEVAGALLAGQAVVHTIGEGILRPGADPDGAIQIRVMLAALLAAALWINLATWIGASVSSTHAVVGGVAGAGILALGAGALNWPLIAWIAGGWVVLPLLSGLVAMLVLAFVTAKVLRAPDRVAAVQIWVPVMVAVMAGCFVIYLGMLTLGPGRPRLVTGPVAVLVAGLVWLAARAHARLQTARKESSKKTLKAVFALPLVLSAALMSFAHGANDVSNAVGPLAAIVAAAQGGGPDIPAWVMLTGALGLAVGLVLFGPRLIRLVGSEITRLNAMRGFCVALATGMTVILASWLGLPVSSTHIAIGAIFGVGWYREREANRRAPDRDDGDSPPEERRRRKLVRRSHVMTMLAAWLVTVPASGLLAGGVFLLLGLIPR